MNFRLTALLFGSLLLLGLVLLGLALFEGEKPPSGDLVLSKLAGTKTDQIDTLELERSDGSRVVFKRAGKDKWVISEPVAARADSAAVDRVVEAALRARATTYPELSPNPAVHGLDQPSLRVTLREGDRSDTLNIGDVTMGGAKAVGFVTTPTRKRPMAVLRSDLDPLFKDSSRTQGKASELAKWVGDYRAKSVFTLNPQTGADDVTEVKITSKGKVLDLTKSGGWTFTTPAGWGEASAGGDASAANPSAITGVRPLLNTLVNLQASSADDFIADPKDLKEYGLNADNPDLIRVEIKPKDGSPEVAFIGKKVDATPPPPPAFPGAPSPPGKVYVRVEGSPGVIRATVSGSLDGVAAIVADPTPLRDRDLLKDTASRFDAIDVTAGGQTVKLRKAAGSPEWKLYGGPNDPQTANQTAVTNLLGLVTQPRVVKDFPATNDANFAPPLTAEIKLWADGIEASTDPKAEPKLKGTPTILQFGKKEATGVFVRRILPTGAKADFLLPEKVKVGAEFSDTDLIAAITRNRLDYLNLELKPFALTQANRLTIAVNGKITEVTSDKTSSTAFPSGKWTYALPADVKGLTADADLIRGDLLNNLASEKPVRIVAEQPSDAELGKFGLDPKNPRVKVSVGLDAGPTPPANADKERVYYFGNETDDHQHVFARQEGKSPVYTVAKLLVDKLTSADLRDKTLVRFDQSKVKKIKVRGWREKTGGEVLTREFDKSGGTWVAVTPPGYMIDPAKVEQFLRDIQAVKVKEFLPAGRRPEHQFPPEQAGFEITIDLDGAPQIVLNIAAPVGDGSSRIASLGTAPTDPLFTVGADTLKAYRDNPAAFAR